MTRRKVLAFERMFHGKERFEGKSMASFKNPELRCTGKKAVVGTRTLFFLFFPIRLAGLSFLPSYCMIPERSALKRFWKKITVRKNQIEQTTNKQLGKARKTGAPGVCPAGNLLTTVQTKVSFWRTVGYPIPL